VTDAERLAALAAAFPLDATTAGSLARQWRALFVNLKGDGSIDGMALGHARNIMRGIDELAWTLLAAERGDDPDIPF
jgi:hypothetical protein